MKLSFCIKTHVLAQLAGVTEAELVYALMTTGELFGVKIPAPLPGRHNAKTRNFDYKEALDFAEELKIARYSRRQD
ncbi:hypothetical protein PYW49_09110 [Enterobacter sp. 170198]|uniref:DNA-binding protein n=1 Tax=Enterobacter chinensis TaxID=3030997 RepID=A0ABU5D1H7_9ENTR|nr:MULTISPECIES: hypothetical protein [Enterobacteriaceae]MDY0417827.1 hypothetical protein [Enterobacter sp. 170198]TFB24718.1 hypothetical protein E3U32_12230 [Lelliottia nimipressuralis]